MKTEEGSGNFRRKLPTGSSLGFFLACFAFAALFIVLGATHSLDALADIFFQLGVLGLGLCGAFLFGKKSSEAEAWNRVRQQSRPARRNLERLVEGLLGVTNTVGEVRDFLQQQATRNNGQCPVEYIGQGLRSVELLVNQQIAAAGNAIEDWGDLAEEEEVREIRATSRMLAIGERRDLSPEEVSILRKEAENGGAERAETN